MFGIDDNNKKSNINIKFFIIIGIIIVIVVIGCIFIFNGTNKKDSNNYFDILDNKAKDIVYSKDLGLSSTDIKMKQAVINLGEDSIAKINGDMAKDYTYFKNYDIDYYTYTYSVSNNILSVLVKVKYKEKDETCYLKYYNSYFIDLDNIKVLNSGDILKKYDINTTKLNYYMGVKISDMYDNFLEKKYIDKEECDLNCFISSLGFKKVDFIEGTVFYINNSNLYAYRNFNTCLNSSIEEHANLINDKILVKRSR